MQKSDCEICIPMSRKDSDWLDGYYERCMNDANTEEDEVNYKLLFYKCCHKICYIAWDIYDLSYYFVIRGESHDIL